MPTLKELKMICQEYGLPISGTKAILQARIDSVENNLEPREHYDDDDSYDDSYEDDDDIIYEDESSDDDLESGKVHKRNVKRSTISSKNNVGQGLVSNNKDYPCAIDMLHVFENYSNDFIDYLTTVSEDEDAYDHPAEYSDRELLKYALDRMSKMY